MEFSGLLNTSLDLNAKPLRILDEALLPKQESERKVAAKQERGALVEEINRVSAENKKLKEMLTVMSENYTQLRNQLMEHTAKNLGVDDEKTASRKRKAECSNGTNTDRTNNINGGRSESSSSDEDLFKKPKEEQIKAKISRVHVRTEASDRTLIVKDGYQWRKYGQKVTRDNPSPRAYFKCSFAPTCPVKKKVQRSIEDQSIVVATYEGEHNHPHPSKLEANSSSNRRSLTLGNMPCSTPVSSCGPTITLDLTKRKPSPEGMRCSNDKVEASQLQQYLVEQMASNLTNDPSFKAALAAAVSGKFLQQK
ncbi:probable WRKY transcription factor 40 [Sesamum indicum]|uniref:Probable WRKY transcription factor 40 n=1 Tax=Sesamum indicum TaxID=4182 RepID=A0A6I9SSR2_SESIN|nr:probable WRKY transcription factor 40 [Sesamum indicum]